MGKYPFTGNGFTPAPKAISEQRNSMPIWIHMALKKIKDVVIVRIDVDGVEMLVGDVFT